MQGWKEIANVAIANPYVGSAKFESNGDWSMIVHQREKEGIDHNAALKFINK